MSVANVWKLSAIVLPAGQMVQVTDSNYQAGLSEMLEGGSGTLDPEFCAVGEARPMLSFSTTALATALGYVGLDAYEIAATTTFFFAKVATGGVIASGSAHLKMTVSKGIVVPRTLEADMGKKPATLSYDLIPVSSDGLTAPVTITTGQALPTITPVSELFTVGPVSLNGSYLQAVQSIKWNFGLKEEIVASDGHAWATFAGVTSREPHCEINGLDITALSSLGLNGLALTAFKTFFRKVASGGTRVAEATAQHVKLSGTAGMLLPRGVKGQTRERMDGDWNICPVFDGTNSCVAVSTGSAIAA